MNYGEIINQLAEANRKLINGEISIDVAKQVGINTQVLINGARLQFEVIKHSESLDNGFFLKKDNIDDVLNEIENNKNKTYKIGE